jgi:hypothetical protein
MAVPEPVRVAVPMTLVPSRKVTDPVGVPPDPVTATDIGTTLATFIVGELRVRTVWVDACCRTWLYTAETLAVLFASPA